MKHLKENKGPVFMFTEFQHIREDEWISYDKVMNLDDVEAYIYECVFNDTQYPLVEEHALRIMHGDVFTHKYDNYLTTIVYLGEK